MNRTRCLLLFTTLFSMSAFTQQPSMANKAIVLKRTVEMNHLSPKPVNDSFSTAVFNNIIKQLDSRNLYFTESEFKLLEAYKTKIDDELLGKSTGFYPLLESTYKKVLLRADSIMDRQLQKPLNFTLNESISMGKQGEFNFAADIASLNNRWNRYLKFSLLSELEEIASADSSGKTTINSVLKENEQELREQLKKVESKAIHRVLDHDAGFSGYVTEVYLNAIASSFDPHTNYFSPQTKEVFKEGLSTEALSFGVDLYEDEDGNILVDKITPGGPAWKSGNISKGDKIISLQKEGKEVVDMNGQSVDDAYDIIEGSGNEQLLVKVKKADGSTRTITMRKEKIENEENIVKSFILQGNKKIGYILLPSFYTEWENESGSSCANDVAKEIVKLKRDGIDGLLLDMRYNGGGSMQEALELTGIFVEEGPLMGVQEKNSKVRFYKDPNRGTIYNGPLAIMINGQSASASEAVAASLQDYNRAVIIGSPTYGKATMQGMYSVDTLTSKPASGAPGKDMVKITVGKLYRLNGTSAQLTGVTPDVLLPDIFEVLEYSERFAPNALQSGTTDKNAYYRPLPALPVQQLAAKSAQRLSADSIFTGIRKLQQDISQRKQTVITAPLTIEGFARWSKQNELAIDKLLQPAVKHNLFTVNNHSLDKAILKNNEYTEQANSRWLESVANDIYLKEAFLTMLDLIEFQKK